MKQFYILAAFILLSLLAKAQFENIDLSNYKLPDIKRHQLDFGFESDQSSERNYKPENIDPKYDINGDINIAYNYYLNTRKKQTTISLNGITSLELNRTKNDNIEWSKRDKVRFGISGDESIRYYLNSAKLFLHLNPGLSYSYYCNHTLIPELTDNALVSKSKTNDINNNVSARISVGSGFGRIEPVGDLRHTLYILEDLLKNERLNRIPNEKEIIETASKISQLKNKRFFDQRLRNIYEIKSLDSLLHKLGLIEKADAVYFTSLNDYWLNFSENRSSGTRYGIDIGLGVSNSWDKSIDKNDNNRNKEVRESSSKSIGGKLYFEHYKPIGLKWQRNIWANSSLNKYFYKAAYKWLDHDRKDETIYFDLSCSYGYTWYLNTRTRLAFNVYGRFGKSKSDDNDYDRQSFDQYFNLDFYYYISPRVRFAFNSNIGYHNVKSEYNDDSIKLIFSNNMNLTYSLF